MIPEIINLNNKSFDKNMGCAVAVGSFDGVHLGHRRLISSLVNEAKHIGVPSAVFTFDTEDNPKSAPILAQTEMKYSILRSLGVDFVVSAPFSAFRDISAENFVIDVLLGFAGARALVCGYDFRFGKDKKGDVQLIRRLVADKASVIMTDAYVHDGSPVSSTRIRKLISDGLVDQAGALLGRYFSFSAPILHGAKLGRKLGFPTVNQAYPHGLVRPRFGVYAVKVRLGDIICGGVANVGIKPTVGSDFVSCETHIFDYTGDCYGEIAEISFLDFIRPEERFNSLEALKYQVEQDKLSALKILEKEKCI